MAKAKTGVNKYELRKRITTKQDLIRYLENVEGLAFVEELWDLAMEKANSEDSKSSDNPISHYFRMFSLPQYRGKAITLRETKLEESSDEISEIMDTYFDDSSGEEFNEITNWIEMFSDPKERQYLKQRYAYYYDNYEINDGADRAMLSRILSLEIDLYRINVKRASAKQIDVGVEQKLNNMLRENFEAMKWTKKQRSATDDMQNNKFTIFMDKQMKQGGFKVEPIELPKDEVDYLIEILPKQTVKMLE